MIPYAVAPLKGLRVLVTRPREQAEGLCGRIAALGGEAIRFPTVAIEPIAIEPVSQVEFDWLIFTSANAVRHGLAVTPRTHQTRIAAIGRATAALLADCNVRVDAQPQDHASSEALLAHPAFANVAEQNVLVVKGVGGRDTLRDTLVQRGARVATLDVYRRVPPQVSAEDIAQLEQRWHDDGIEVVTLTSVEILENLLAMLSDAGRALLRANVCVTLHERIGQRARELGLAGEMLVARTADDEGLLGAIAAWHARAR